MEKGWQIEGVTAFFMITDVDKMTKWLEVLEDTVQVNEGAIGDLGAEVDAVSTAQDQQRGV